MAAVMCILLRTSLLGHYHMHARFFRWLVRLAGLLACLSQTACLGVTTPEIQEFWGTPDDGREKVQAIVSQVRCELGRALHKYLHDPDTGRLVPELLFLQDWGIQVVLVLSVEEKSTLSPGASIISPLQTATTTFGIGQTVTSPQSFTGGFGGVYSNDATTNDRTTIFYTVKQLDSISWKGADCKPEPTKATLFVQSDLGIDYWLNRNLNIEEFENANLNLGHIENVLSHDVKFEIVSSGSVTPQWKLVRFTGNTTNPLFMASRDRIQELIITMGRVDKVGGGLSQAAAISSLASQLGAATGFNNRIR